MMFAAKLKSRLVLPTLVGWLAMQAPAGHDQLCAHTEGRVFEDDVDDYVTQN